MLKLKRAALIAVAWFASLSCAGAPDEPIDQELSEILVPRFAQQAYIKASNPGALDGYWQHAVSADGNTLVVGARWEDSDGSQGSNAAPDSGAVYVYTRSGVSWMQQAYLKASNSEADDMFGAAVALSADGNTLVVGAPGEDSTATNVGGSQTNNSLASSGAAYVFRRNASTWTQHAYIKASNTGAGDTFGVSVALSGDGNTLAVGATKEDSSADNVGGSQDSNNASSAGAVYVYALSGTMWATQAYIKASNSDAGDLFGMALALSTDGNTLAVGATDEDSSATGIGGNQIDNSASAAGAAYVYARTGTSWASQAYVKASNTGATDRFGLSLSLSGDGNTLVVGANSEDSSATGINGNSGDNSSGNSGAAYVYTRSAGSWSVHTYLKAPNTDVGDCFGQSVALSSNGSMLAVGAIGEDSGATGVDGIMNDESAEGSGAVFTYGLVNGSFRLHNYVKASNTEAGDIFGHVALSSDGATLVVTASGESSGFPGNQNNNSSLQAGAAYVFTSTLVPTFEQQAYVKASNTDAGDSFQNVALSDDGNTLVVGAPGEDGSATGVNGNDADNTVAGSGAAYVYLRSVESWAQQAYVKASNTSASDAFGAAVALSADGNTLAVGAPGEDSNATGIGGSQSDNSASNSGAVYIFTRSGGLWTQQAYVKASIAEAGDAFGTSVALSGDGNTLVVGAVGEDGVSGNQSSNSASNSGAAYVFTRSGGAWSQQAYVKASNAEASDGFGRSVALSSNGDTLASSAPGEDSGATLVNGNTADNTKSGSGAAYVFTRSAGSWTQQAYVKAPTTDAGDSLSIVALSADGNTLAVGIPFEDSIATNVNGDQSNNSSEQAGAANVYTRSGSSWTHQAYLKASNTGSWNGFGSALALSDDGSTLAVSAPGENGAATGVNGNRYDGSSFETGAVFMFARSGGSWSRGDYVKASNISMTDAFGLSVAISSNGNTLVAATGNEDSAATGINGGQGDDIADSGAAYVFTR
jgi:hypothetical protein